jgi:predicted enzyme related to lactoylglutathione lyase
MNHFGHIEIPVKDIVSGRKFFGNVFGWKFQNIPGLEYVMFRTEHKPNGGLFKVKRMPKSGQINVYIEVKDIKATLAKVRKSRGTVIVGKTSLGDMGWFATFGTPDGCHLSLWQKR